MELKAYGTAQLPLDSIPLLTFENGKGFERDGEHGSLKDYAINEIGPAEVTAAQIAVAKKRGMRGGLRRRPIAGRAGSTAHSPICRFRTSGTHATRRSKSTVSTEPWRAGAMVSSRTTLPNCAPGIAGAMRRRSTPCCARSRAANSGAAPKSCVLNAWQHFSHAIRLVPDTGPNMGVNNAVAAPLFFEKPQAAGHDAGALLVGSGGLVAGIADHAVLALHSAAADPAAGLHQSGERSRAIRRAVFTAGISQVPAAWRPRRWRRASNCRAGRRSRRPNRGGHGAFRDVLLAEQIAAHDASDAAVLEFEDNRFRLAHATTAQRKHGWSTA